MNSVELFDAATVAPDIALSDGLSRPRSPIAVHGLDQFEVAVRGVPVRGWRAGKARNLLQYLLLRQGRVVSKDALFDALWPTSSTSGSSSLKVAVHMLRRTLDAAQQDAPDAMLRLRTSGEGYVLDVENVFVDFQEFDELIDTAHALQRHAPERAMDHFRRAVRLYRGDFLPTVRLDWAEVHREWLRSRALLALDRLRSADLAGGDYLAVIGWCRRTLDLEPYCEDAYRTLLTLHGCAGELNQVRRWFTVCRTRLRQDLNCEPEKATLDVFVEASRGDLIGLDPADVHWSATR